MILKSILLIGLQVASTAAAVRGQEKDQVPVYLFPGQGADQREFMNFRVPEGYDTVHVEYPMPRKKETLSEYALRFIPMIDQSKPFVLLGISLGGMICTELADTLRPQNVILVSSAKSNRELPGRYRFMRKFPLNRVVPENLTKAGALVLQGLVEPDIYTDRDTFRAMLRKKDPAYLKRTVDMIVHWDRTFFDPGIVQIHGDRDHTIPLKNVKTDFVIHGGSHVMILTRAEDVNRIVNEILTGREMNPGRF